MFDQSTAVARLDLQDPAKIALVPLVLDSALAIAETYCDRFFSDQDTTETVIPVNGNTIKVHRFPIQSVSTIIASHGGTAVGDYHVDKKAGVVYLDGRGFWHEATISYKGGFSILPADIELALWLIFDSIWAATPGAGRVAGSVSASAGAIKSVSTPDAGSITYFDPSISAASSAGTFLPADAITLLNPYRRLDV